VVDGFTISREERCPAFDDSLILRSDSCPIREKRAFLTKTRHPEASGALYPDSGLEPQMSQTAQIRPDVRKEHAEQNCSSAFPFPDLRDSRYLRLETSDPRTYIPPAHAQTSMQKKFPTAPQSTCTK
jgi:hypothetical protein